MKGRIYITAFLFTLSAHCTSFADAPIDTQSIKDAGFVGVSQILNQMTPQQRAEVMRQAESMKPQMEKMSQKEIDGLTKQMLDMESTLDFNAVDVSKLAPSTSKNLQGIQNDVAQYNKLAAKEKRQKKHLKR